MHSGNAVSRLAAFGLALLLAGCASAPPPPPPPAELPKGDLPLQIALQVQLIGLREALPSLPPTRPVPPSALIPLPSSLPASVTVAPTGLVGLELPRAEYEEWLRALAASGRAAVYLSPVFTVWPGRSAAAHSMQELRYVANWSAAPKSLAAEYRTLQRGFSLTAFPAALPGWKDLLVRFKLDFLAGDAPAAPVSEGVRSGPPPLTVDLPSRATHSIATATPVRHGHSLVVAHMARVFAAPAVEHLICVVTLDRTGQEPPVEPNLVPTVPPRRYTLTLAWDTPPPAPSETPPSLLLDPAESLPEARATLLSVLVASGENARLEWSEAIARVAGVTGDTTTVRRLNVIENWAGAVLEANPAAGADGRQLTTRLRARLAVRPECAVLTQMLPPFRVPGSAEFLEKYRFRLCRQLSTQIDQPLMLSVGVEQPLDALWSGASDAPELFPPPVPREQKLSILATETPLLLTPTAPPPREVGP
jgi:hypothetical protein